jgi:AAA15 family ATPase/GTPase
MITHLELKNFTTFEKLSIDFSPKINVIIGENGTGKTHLLKAAYGLCLNKDKSDTEELEKSITSKLTRLFMPLDDKLGKIHRSGSSEQASLSAYFDDNKQEGFTLNFYNNSKSISVQKNTLNNLHHADPVYIPTKEVLSFMKGFSSLYEKYGLSFDQSYQDICLLLDLPEVRQEVLHPKSKWAMEEIEKICGGRFVFYGGGKVTFKTDNTEYSANAMAEGFRKIGMLSRLLETGAIQPGVSGTLFWDEPESNINPKLIKVLVQILLELSRNGQQIILATHDYVFLKWFDLLMKKELEHHVRFHSLYRDESGTVKVSSVDDYVSVSKSAISDTFAELYDEDVSRALG